jgi:shikimate dehydrogenase
MTDLSTKTIRLGLIGDNIARSKSPRLHRMAGGLTGLEVTYERLIPRDMGLTFADTFARARGAGFRGINVTYPYKEVVARMVALPDPRVAAIGAVNTVVFGPDGPQGFNTDFTGFKRAYAGVMGDAAPGTVCLIGAGGVGKAVAFGLLDLGAEVIRCVDLDPAKAEGLAAALRAAAGPSRIEVATDPAQAALGAQRLVNCTPLGMVGIGGTPLPRAAMGGAAWAFDAVYTPVDTDFLRDATAEGLRIISGYELFFGQGVDAWDIFTGVPLDHAALRQAISGEPT